MIVVERLIHFHGNYRKMLRLLKEDQDRLEYLDYKDNENFQLIINEVHDAFEVLTLCRLTLMSSYAFNFFFTTFNNEIFLYGQTLTNLEKFTDKLREKIMKTVQFLTNSIDIQVELADEIAVSLQCRRHILEKIQEGHKEGWWKKFPITIDQAEAGENSFKLFV